MQRRVTILVCGLAVLFGLPAGAARADLSTGTPLPFVIDQPNPVWLAVDPIAQHVFVSGGPGNSSIVVADFDGNIVQTIQGEPGASEMADDPATHTLYVALTDADAISAIDTNTLTETSRFSTLPAKLPTSLVLAGGKLWFSGGYDYSGLGLSLVDSVNLDGTNLEIDPGELFPFATPTVLAAGGAHGQLLAVADSWVEPPRVSVYDVSHDPPTLINTADENNAGSGNDLAFDPSSNEPLFASGYPYAALTLDATTLQPTIAYPFSGGPTAFTANADGGYVAAGWNPFPGSPYSVTIYRAGNTTPVASWKVSGDTWNAGPILDHALIFSPDGSELFAVSTTSTGPALFVIPNAANISLAPSQDTVTYGASAKVNTFVADDWKGRVNLYGTPLGRQTRLVAHGRPDASQQVNFTVKPTRVTAYHAVFKSTTRHATSSAVTISVRPHLSITVNGLGLNLTLAGTIKPHAAGTWVEFDVQHYYGGIWHDTASLRTSIPPHGQPSTPFTARHGGKYRARVVFYADAAYTRAASHWKTFKLRPSAPPRLK